MTTSPPSACSDDTAEPIVTILFVNTGKLQVVPVLVELLTRAHYCVHCVPDLDGMIEFFYRYQAHLVIAACRSDESQVEQISRYLEDDETPVPLIVLAEPSTVNDAVRCMQLGACQYLDAAEDPLDLLEELDQTCQNIVNQDPRVKISESLRLRLSDYQLLRVLGQGSIGVVFEAYKKDKGLVALKVLNPMGDAVEAGKSAELLERFINEAEAALKVNSPQVVRVFEYGIEPREMIPYMVMEYFPSRSLREYMERRSSDPQYRQDAGIILQAAQALKAIHAAGICHRDMKPGNILINRELQAKVTDFGVALLPNSKLTMPGQIIGSPAYLSPEGCCTSRIDARADIFSLGIVAYELLIGTHPFISDTIPQYLQRIQTASPPAPSKCIRGFPRKLEQILARMLRKKPADRYQNADELIHDLSGFLAPKASASESELKTESWWTSLFRSDWR